MPGVVPLIVVDYCEYVRDPYSGTEDKLVNIIIRGVCGFKSVATLN
jgi:hypothetical protein